ncbi:leucyl/phenylalanyl-tRNA--protein transferase [Sneathiella sp.]|uniref:leucyl/phenylalanyl-tRNA--protein transferase n=1 Tax=Sneathiella sp. TaxID=1964365 RepID=UPI003566087A
MTGLTAEMILNAYMRGVFPMSEARDDPDLFWVDPELRGIFPLDDFHVPKRLAKTIRKMPFEVTIDTAFRRVMRECAADQENRHTTWINQPILDLYGELHDRGFAHSVECWQDGELAGGLYGVSFASVFCGESMFTRVTDASKVALVYLVARLIHGGFTLLDAQFITDHLARFGALEIARADYHARLKLALTVQGDFYSLPPDLGGLEILQSITHTS